MKMTHTTTPPISLSVYNSVSVVPFFSYRYFHVQCTSVSFVFSFFSSLFCGVVEDGIQAVPPRATNPSKHIHTQCFEPKLYFISTVQCINSYTNTKLGKVVSILSQNCLCIFKIILILIHLVDRALFLVSTTSLVDAPVHLQVVLTWCFQL